MEQGHSFVPLLVVVVLAFLAPLVVGRLKRLRLPVVVGEILAGILVGDTRLRLDDVVTMLVAPDDLDEICRIFACD